jgi:hypothetical protein
MKLFFTLMIFLSPLASFAAPKYSMILSGEKQAGIWLDQRTISKKQVYLLGYQSGSAKSIERAVPKSEYKRLAAELTSWTKKGGQQSLPVAGPACAEPVVFCFF